MTLRASVVVLVTFILFSCVLHIHGITFLHNWAFTSVLKYWLCSFYHLEREIRQVFEEDDDLKWCGADLFPTPNKCLWHIRACFKTGGSPLGCSPVSKPLHKIACTNTSPLKLNVPCACHAFCLHADGYCLVSTLRLQNFPLLLPLGCEGTIICFGDKTCQSIPKTSISQCQPAIEWLFSQMVLSGEWPYAHQPICGECWQV